MTASRKPLGATTLAVLVGALLQVLASSEGVVPNPTFAKDIAPIFREKCESCHRPDSVAPMSLTTNEETRPWARAIRNRVEARQMPPWHLDRSVGIQELKNDRSLSDDQIATIVRWITTGAPRGDSRDLPPPKEWPNERAWNLAAQFGQTEPDLIVRSVPLVQKAGATSVFWKPVVATGLTEPRWVRAIEIRPTSVEGRTITHHILAGLVQDEADPLAQNQLGPKSGPQPGLFMEWAIGSQGEVMRPDSGKLMLPGSKISWDIHYASGSEDITASAEMGVYFYPKGQQPKFRQVLHLMGSGNPADLDIPPNAVKQTEGSFVMKENGRVESMQPRMHFRGKAMSLEATLPDGQTQVLSRVSNFDFNWQTNYQYADAAAPLLPKGTILKIVASHDNTTANKANPDPNLRVGYGERPEDELAQAWVSITYLRDAEYGAELAARKALLAKRAAQQP